MSNLETHARRELERAGLFKPDSDYGGMLGEAVMRLVRAHAAEGHSGLSAEMAMQLFEKVGRFKALTPVTNDPDEWMDVADMGSDGSPPLWQNRRQSSCFSNDGGKTYYDIDAGDNRKIHQSQEAE